MTTAVRYLSPRDENRSARLAALLRTWDLPVSADQQDEIGRRVPMRQQRSAYGNLNHEGTPYTGASCLANRFHPDFESLIEPRVLPLVAAIAVDLDLVTYTSCEGHHYVGMPRRADERHVGVIARNAGEIASTLVLFESAAVTTNARHRGAAAEVALMRHTVLDGEVAYPAIDLYVCKAIDAPWEAYFADVDAVCSSLTEELIRRAR